MSTQVQLHVRHEQMTDQMLEREGHLHGGMHGIMNQLMTPTTGINEEFNDLLSESDNYIVGRDTDEFPKRIRDLFEGCTTVDGTLIKQVQAVIEDHGDRDGELALWLEQRKDEEVFAISW